MHTKQGVNVHIYSARFSSESDAMSFVDPAYSVDGDANSLLWDDLGSRVDNDFVETVFGDSRYPYLESILIDGKVSDEIRALDNVDNNTFILVYGIERNSTLTPNRKSQRIRYLASFPVNLT